MIISLNDLGNHLNDRNNYIIILMVNAIKKIIFSIIFTIISFKNVCFNQSVFSVMIGFTLNLFLIIFKTILAFEYVQDSEITQGTLQSVSEEDLLAEKVNKPTNHRIHSKY